MKTAELTLIMFPCDFSFDLAKEKGYMLADPEVTYIYNADTSKEEARVTFSTINSMPKGKVEASPYLASIVVKSAKLYYGSTGAATINTPPIYSLDLNTGVITGIASVNQDSIDNDRKYLRIDGTNSMEAPLVFSSKQSDRKNSWCS